VIWTFPDLTQFCLHKEYSKIAWYQLPIIVGFKWKSAKEESIYFARSAFGKIALKLFQQQINLLRGEHVT